MSNKKQIKKVFEEEFNIENMRLEILKKEENQKEKYIDNYFMYVLPVCLIIFICAVSFIPLKHPSNNDYLMNLDTITPAKETIKVNKIDGVTLIKLDADIKIEPSTNFINKEFAIPEYLNEQEAYAVYTKNELTNDYNIFNSYVYNYFNESQTKNIKLSFSDTAIPIRDYYFEEVGEVTKIKDVNLYIYQYKETYFTKFSYNNYNYDIETNGINLEEFSSLLNSIIN